MSAVNLNALPKGGRGGAARRRAWGDLGLPAQASSNREASFIATTPQVDGTDCMRSGCGTRLLHDATFFVRKAGRRPAETGNARRGERVLTRPGA